MSGDDSEDDIERARRQSGREESEEDVVAAQAELIVMLQRENARLIRLLEEIRSIAETRMRALTGEQDKPVDDADRRDEVE
jgi:hypothetical protein